MTDAPRHPCSELRLEAADGAVVRFCAHGGHVLGWAPAGGSERLWLSRDSGCGAGTAIRGGVPVVWPQFAGRGDGPRHGIARDRTWTVLSTGTSEDGAATATLELRSDAATRAVFAHAFTLTLDVRAAGAELALRLTARNDGVEPFSTTAALHTYLRVSSTADARVDGLQGMTATQNDGSGETVLPEAPLQVTGPIDLAVDLVGAGDGGADVVLRDPALGDLVVGAEGFDSRVVWNPGPGRAPGDVHAGGEAEFVCLEPALLHPLVLGPGETWTGRQVLRAAQAPG